MKRQFRKIRYLFPLLLSIALPITTEADIHIKQPQSMNAIQKEGSIEASAGPGKQLQEVVYPSSLNATVVLNTGKSIHVSQLGTGVYSKLNCGPACASMIGKYYGKDINIVEYNKQNHPTAKGYSAANLKTLLAEYNIVPQLGNCNNKTSGKVEETCLVNYLDKGYIAILAIYTEPLSLKGTSNISNSGIERFAGRTYNGDFYHFVVCTGYLKIEDELYYYLLDPLESGYSIIKATELADAIAGNWNKCFLFE